MNLKSFNLSTRNIGIIGLIVALGIWFQGEQIYDKVRNNMDVTTYEVSGERMYLAGDFNAKSRKTLKKAIRKHEDVTTLVLTNMPGSMDDVALFKFARWVRDQGLNTHLQSDSKIASGAVDLFLAGNKRTMEVGAKIGVHAWDDRRKEATDFPPNHKAHRLYSNFVEDMLGYDDFYWFSIKAAPSSDIHWVTQNEIQKFELLTEPMFTVKTDT